MAVVMDRLASATMLARNTLSEETYQHAERVSRALYDHLGMDAAVAGMLHDVAEDTDIGIEFIMLTYGVKIGNAVATVTRHLYSTETYQEFINRIVTNGTDLGREVKIADLLDNIGRPLRTATHASLEKRYVKALTQLLATRTIEDSTPTKEG